MGEAGPLRRVVAILLALAILPTSQAFQLAAPGSEEAQHHHHHHDHDHAHGHDHHEHIMSENLNGVISDIFEGDNEVREGKAVSETLEEAVARGGVDFSEAEVVTEEDGTVKECVEKEEIREEYRREPVVECVHKSVERCHYTYTTQFLPHVQEVCEETFVKHCTISINQVAVNETVKHCYRPLVSDCDVEDPEGGECKEYFESSCTTRYIEKSPGSFVGDTACERLPKVHCAPPGCQMLPGEEECHDKTVGTLSAQPEEHCDLTPRTHCRHKTTLVPRLKPEPECTIVPKEVCTVKHVQKLVSVPHRSLWCQLVEPEVATDRSPEPRTTTEEPLPGYSNNDLPGYATDDLPGYVDEDLSGYVDEDLSGYATDLPPPLPFPTFEITTEGYEYPIPLEPLQPPSPVTTARPTTITTTTTTTTTQPPIRPPTTEATQPPVTDLTLPIEPVVVEPPTTIQLRPEDLQAEIMAALRVAVRDAVTMAVELQAVSLANRQSLRNNVQAAVLQAVRASVLQSVSSQAESRRAQSSLALQLAVQSAVRSAVERAVMTMLAGSSGTVMTGGMKKELVVMEESLQAAVAGAVREAVRAAVQRGVQTGAVQRGVQEEQSRKTAEESRIQAAIEAAVRRAVRITLEGKSSSGDRQAGQIAVREAVGQAVTGAVRRRVAQGVEGETRQRMGRAVMGELLSSLDKAFLNAREDGQDLSKTGLLETQLVGLMKKTVAERLGLASNGRRGRERTPRLLEVPRVDSPTSMFDH